MRQAIVSLPLCRERDSFSAMRVIGHLENEPAARRFGDFLYVHGVVNTVERDENAWAIWVHEDDHLKKAGDWLAAFRTNPADPQFDTAAKASVKRDEEKEDLKEYQKRFKTRRDVFRRLTPYGVGKLTVLFIAISIVVAIFSRLGDNPKPIMGLYIASWEAIGNSIQWDGLSEIRHGQIWRLFTPMFIHFGILHIVFNMMWLRDLGSMIEGNEGPRRLLLVILLSAGISNFAQYAIEIPGLPMLSGGHPSFGGMSGVVYGLLGYIWMRGKFDPTSGLFLHKYVVIQMLVWLFLCMTPLIGNVANLAHVFGLLVGMTLGFVYSRLRRA